MGREALVKIRCGLTVVFGFVSLATQWCGPFEKCIVGFCSVPQGGVKKKRNRPGTDWAVCRGLQFFGMRWHKKREKNWSRTDRAVCLPILTIYFDLVVKRKQN